MNSDCLSWKHIFSTKPPWRSWSTNYIQVPSRISLCKCETYYDCLVFFLNATPLIPTSCRNHCLVRSGAIDTTGTRWSWQWLATSIIVCLRNVTYYLTLPSLPYISMIDYHHIPDAPCMAYSPTFTTKMAQFCGQYSAPWSIWYLSLLLQLWIL